MSNKNTVQPAFNSDINTWNIPVNANTQNFDDALGTVQTFALTGVSGTVAVTGTSFAGPYPANTASYIPLIFICSGVPTGAVTLQIPASIGGIWVVNNQCTGAFSVITVSSAGAGTTANIPAATSATVYSDGTNVTLTSTAVSASTSLNDNRIINGNFSVNQRGQVSGVALAAAAYGHDRWKAGASGCTYTFTTTVPDTTITIGSGTLTQIIEAGWIEGGVYTVSWTGGAQARVYQGSPTGSYAASPLTTGALTAGTNTTVEFNTGTLGRVQFEVGSVATPFNRLPLAEVFVNCQRYYQTSGVKPGSAPGGGSCLITISGASGGGFGGTITFPAMRATPTCVLYDGAGTPGAVSYFDTVWHNGGSTIQRVSPQNLYVQVATSAGLIDFNYNYAVSAEL